MKKFLNKVVRFRKDEDGAALVEYGIALLVVILVGTGAMTGIASGTSSLFGNAKTAACGAATTGAGGTAPANC